MKEIIRPRTQNYTIRLPKEYLNRDIMIHAEIISSDDDKPGKHTDTIIKTAGILSKKKIDPIAWQKRIRSEWEERT
ncbi:MAG: hypothetical protein SVV67_11215 [Bacillota bacterium]|nr:hypothetical protein [Bacillota bacterium]